MLVNNSLDSLNHNSKFLCLNFAYVRQKEQAIEAIVQVVRHTNLQTVGQGYYSGKQESEVPAVRSLLKSNELAGQKITFDALHCQPKTSEIIVAGGGK